MGVKEDNKEFTPIFYLNIDSEAMGRIQLPVVSVYNNNKTFNFILDTGSVFSVINKDEVPNLDYSLLDSNGGAYGIDGNKIETKFIRAIFTTDTIGFIEDFQVFDIPGLRNIEKESGIKVVGLLGSAFFQRYRFQIDFDRMIAISKCDGVSSEPADCN